MEGALLELTAAAAEGALRHWGGDRAAVTHLLYGAPGGDSEGDPRANN